MCVAAETSWAQLPVPRYGLGEYRPGVLHPQRGAETSAHLMSQPGCGLGRRVRTRPVRTWCTHGWLCQASFGCSTQPQYLRPDVSMTFCFPPPPPPRCRAAARCHPCGLTLACNACSLFCSRGVGPTYLPRDARSADAPCPHAPRFRTPSRRPTASRGVCCWRGPATRCACRAPAATSWPPATPSSRAWCSCCRVGAD